MSFLCSAFILYFISLIYLSACFQLPSSTRVQKEKMRDEYKVDDRSYIILVLLKPYSSVAAYNIDEGTRSNRDKRDTEASKFSSSKNLSQSKVLQLYLQLYKDIYTSRYMERPVHPESIKPVLKRFKAKIIKLFFPEAARMPNTIPGQI